MFNISLLSVSGTKEQQVHFSFCSWGSAEDTGIVIVILRDQVWHVRKDLLPWEPQATPFPRTHLFAAAQMGGALLFIKATLNSVWLWTCNMRQIGMEAEWVGWREQSGRLSYRPETRTNPHICSLRSLAPLGPVSFLLCMSVIGRSVDTQLGFSLIHKKEINVTWMYLSFYNKAQRARC